MPLAALPALDLVPGGQDLPRGAQLGAAEDVRMAAHQLAVLAQGHVLDVELLLLPGDLGVQQNLQEQVAQLVFDLVPLAAAQGFLQLAGFLAQELYKRKMGLLPIPRTAFRRTEVGN